MAHSDDKQSMKEAYVKGLQSQELIFQEIEQFLQEKKRSIQVNKNFARLMSVLLTAIRARKVVEIGTLAGYSSLWIAKSLEEDGRVWTIEKDPKWAEIAKDFISKTSWKDKVTNLVGDAKIILEDLKLKGPFDAVFIDADKGGYLDYLNWALENLRSGGLIMGDNTFLGGAVYGSPSRSVSKTSLSVIQEFNVRLSDPEKFVSVCLPLGDGFFVGIKK